MKRADQLRECAAKGMSAAEAAEALGLKISTVYWHCSTYGIKLRDTRSEASAERIRKLHQDPEFAAANAERMRKLNQDPEFAAPHAERAAERMRKLHQDPTHNPLVLLTETERADYDLLKKAGYTRQDALRAIGRADLIREAAE